MKEDCYFNANWLRCLGDYRTDCDGSPKLRTTICGKINNLNEVFSRFNNQTSLENDNDFTINQIVYLAKRLDKVLADVKDYHRKLVDGDVDEIITMNFWQSSTSYQWLRGKRLEKESARMKDLTLEELGLPSVIEGHETKTVNDVYRWIKQNIHELKTTMSTIRGITSRLSMASYGNIYERQMEEVDPEPIQHFFDLWKMSIIRMNFDEAKNFQTIVVTDFVNSGIFRFGLPVSTDDENKVDLEKIKARLYPEYTFIKDFKKHAAVFRKFFKWKGHIIVIDREGFGKYICQHILEFTENELQALFLFEMLLRLIHEEMLNLPPEERKKVFEGDGEAELFESEVKETKAEAPKVAKMELELTPVDRFVNRVKDIMMEATKRNGERIVTNTRAWQGEYTFFVDGERIAVMMDDLRKNYEEKITEFLEPYQRCDGVSVVAPFIGRMLDIEELRAKDLQKSDLDFAFSPYYNNGASAVKKMSNKLDDDTNVLFGTFEGLLKKYPSTLFA